MAKRIAKEIDQLQKNTLFTKCEFNENKLSLEHTDFPGITLVFACTMTGTSGTYPFKCPYVSITGTVLNNIMCKFLEFQIKELEYFANWSPQNMLLESATKCFEVIRKFCNIQHGIMVSEKPQAILNEGKYFTLLMENVVHEIIPGLFLGGINKPTNAIPKFNFVISATKKNEDWLTEYEKNRFILESDDNEKVGIETLKNNNCEEIFHAVRLIIYNLMVGGNVFVHCMQGINKSVTIVIVALMTLYGGTVEQTLNKIRSVRYIADPTSVYMDFLYSELFVQRMVDFREKF